jgi:diguanylate cyclase (GGDEF)-like protein
VRLFSFSLILLSLCFSGKALAALDADNLHAELEAMEVRVHTDPLGVWEELTEAESLLARADDQTQLWFYLRRAQAHNALFMYTEFERDIASAQSMKTVAAPPSLLIMIDVYAGLIEVRRGNLRRGIEIFDRAAQLAVENKANRAYVLAVQELAYTRGLLEQYDESLQDLHRAYTVALELNQADLIAMVNDAYGAVYAYMADYPRSIEYHLLALAEFNRLGYKEQTASVIQGLASTYRYAGQWQLAEKFFQQYLQFTGYAPGDRQLFYGNYGLAMTYAELPDCQRAMPQIQVALQYAGPEDYKAELYKQQARCEALDGNFANAEAALQRAADILHGIPELAGTTWVLELAKIESDIEYRRGNADRAFVLLSGYYDAHTRQTEKSSSDRMNMLRADLENDRKDLEIALLEQQAQVNQLQVEAQREENQTQRYVIGLSLAISAGILSGLLVQRRNNRRILALSHRDSLSGLYNRRYTFEYMARVIPKISVDDGGLSIILLDIDDFKNINDSYGHPVGDAVIKRVADIGVELLRNRDIMGRIGGEEFLCVLPRTTAEQSMQVAHRLLTAISNEKLTATDGTHFFTSISIGIANYDPSIDSAEQLYSRADEALYQSKAAGKGRITAYQAG